MSDLQAFESALRHQLGVFTGATPPRPRPFRVGPLPSGLTVHLAVREHPLAPDYRFTYQAATISRLQARIEAERAAREAGWPIIGYVIDYERH